MERSDRIRARAVAYGRVQGVFFRARCKDEAELRGVAGWVSNRDDGAVEAVFEGPPDDVKAMVEWMRDGPPRARVERVKLTTEPAENLEGFTITGSRTCQNYDS